MKKYRLIGIIALALSLALFSFIIYNSSRKAKVPQNLEPKYENMTLLGTEQGSYQYGKAFQNEDGSVMIASVLTPEAGKADKVSIIKLSQEGELIWEHTFALEKTSWLDHLKRDKADRSLRIMQISSYQDYFFVVLTRLEQQSDVPYILKLNQDGKLVEFKQIDLLLEHGTSLQSYINANKLYLSYLKSSEKMLCLSQIDLLTAEVLHTSVRFIRQKNLNINAVAADPSDSVVSITAYDKDMGCSFFQYTSQTDLKEIFRTQVNSDIKLLKYNADRLYGAVKEDSLLEIIDLTDLMKPLIKVTNIQTTKDFRLIDLLILEDKFHVMSKTVTIRDTGQKEALVEISSYNSDGSTTGKAALGSSEFDQEKQLIGLKDGLILILGESSSNADSKITRLYLKKIK